MIVTVVKIQNQCMYLSMMNGWRWCIVQTYIHTCICTHIYMHRHTHTHTRQCYKASEREKFCHLWKYTTRWIWRTLTEISKAQKENTAWVTCVMIISLYFLLDWILNYPEDTSNCVYESVVREASLRGRRHPEHGKRYSMAGVLAWIRKEKKEKMCHAPASPFLSSWSTNVLTICPSS